MSPGIMIHMQKRLRYCEILGVIRKERADNQEDLAKTNNSARGPS